jgi:hypothetical protein
MHTCLWLDQWWGPATLRQAVVYVLAQHLPQRRLRELRPGIDSGGKLLVKRPLLGFNFMNSHGKCRCC